ncbi:MAG TPA: hotdog fold domain-containing protein [bacterium]|nr:hotdog fold domain-containing protein [bacterium]
MGWTAKVTLRLGPKDAHYSGGLVAGAKILELFGDAATALCLRETHGRDEGLFRAYDSVDFLKPVYAGDVLEATARIVRIGNTSRGMEFTARKKGKGIVCRASGTVVIPDKSSGPRDTSLRRGRLPKNRRPR